MRGSTRTSKGMPTRLGHFSANSSIHCFRMGKTSSSKRTTLMFVQSFVAYSISWMMFSTDRMRKLLPSPSYSGLVSVFEQKVQVQ